jgi:NADH dehydrogenase
MRIAVLGAGYAGLTLARKLERIIPDDVEILVIERTGTHLVQHELHRAIRRPSLADEIVLDLEDVLDRPVVRQAEVADLNPDAGVVSLTSGEELGYDYAAVCLGAETAFYDLPGVEDHATPLKTLDHAERVRADFLDALESSDRSNSTARIVVGGAGLSGVQVAGELAAFAREQGFGESATITLLEQMDDIAPSFPENFREAVRDQLEARDVEVRTGTAVASATDSTVELETGEAVGYDQLVWTGGIRGPAALDGERPTVKNTLRVGDGTFIVGDAARVVDADGEPVPASAQAAVREARVVAQNIASLVEYDREGDDIFEPRLEPFAFESPGWLVSVGDGAVAQIGPKVLTGAAAKALKTTVGAGYLSSVGAIRNAADLVSEELGHET